MAKFPLTRILETGKFLQSEAGQQLNEFISYVSDFANRTLLALRNGLTIADNLDALVVQATLKHETEQVINSNGRRPLVILHAATSSVTAVTALVWSINSSGQLTVTPTFKGAPSGEIPVVLVLIFQ